MKNATPNVAVVSSSDEYSLEVGKNSSAITTVMKPNTVKSYHSSALPITAAATARRFSARSGRLVFVEFAIVAMRASSSSVRSPGRGARVPAARRCAASVESDGTVFKQKTPAIFRRRALCGFTTMRHRTMPHGLNPSSRRRCTSPSPTPACREGAARPEADFLPGTACRPRNPARCVFRVLRLVDLRRIGLVAECRRGRVAFREHRRIGQRFTRQRQRGHGTNARNQETPTDVFMGTRSNVIGLKAVLATAVRQNNAHANKCACRNSRDKGFHTGATHADTHPPPTRHTVTHTRVSGKPSCRPPAAQARATRWSRRLDAEQVHGPAHAMLRGALHDEVRRRLAGARELRPDARVRRLQRVVGQPGQNARIDA